MTLHERDERGERWDDYFAQTCEIHPDCMSAMEQLPAGARYLPARLDSALSRYIEQGAPSYLRDEIWGLLIDVSRACL